MKTRRFSAHPVDDIKSPLPLTDPREARRSASGPSCIIPTSRTCRQYHLPDYYHFDVIASAACCYQLAIELCLLLSTPQQTPNSQCFSLGQTIPQNCTCSWKDVDPMVPWAHQSQPQTASQPFLQGSRRDQQIDHATPSVAICRI